MLYVDRAKFQFNSRTGVDFMTQKLVVLQILSPSCGHIIITPQSSAKYLE